MAQPKRKNRKFSHRRSRSKRKRRSRRRTCRYSLRRRPCQMQPRFPRDHRMPLDVKVLADREKAFNAQDWGLWHRKKLPSVNRIFKYWGRKYKIAKSGQLNAGRGLFIMEEVEGGVNLMPYAGAEYGKYEWQRLAPYSPKRLNYGLFVSAAEGRNPDKRPDFFIDGRPEEFGNIAGLINSSVHNLELTNCGYELLDYADRPLPGLFRTTPDRYVMIRTTRSIPAGSELFAYYLLDRGPLESYEAYKRHISDPGIVEAS